MTGVLLVATLGFAPDVPADGRSVNPPTDTPPVYDIPFARGISIDGDGADWKEAGFRVEFMPDMNGITQPQASFEPKSRLAWDKRGLLLLLKVRDDIIVESADESLLGEQDSAEVFLGAGRGSCEYYSLVLVPGITPALPEMRVKPIDLRKKEPRAPLSYEAARTKSADGYVLEALLPWANLGITPRRGAVVALQVIVNDSDGPQGRFQAVWYPSARTRFDSMAMWRLRLERHASPPDVARARGEYDYAMRPQVSVLTLGEFAGKPVAVMDGRSTLVCGVLKQSGDYAQADLTFDAPEVQKAPRPWRVRIADKYDSSLSMPDADRLRAQRVMLLAATATPPVFMGDKFPACDFADPLLAERLIGPYTVEMTYYDRSFNPVTSATKPGRYGAVLKIKAASGRILRRYATLFRAPAFDSGLSWRYLEPRLSMRIPDEANIAPSIVQTHSRSLGTFMRFSMLDSLAKGQDAAVLYAGLYEAQQDKAAGRAIEADTYCTDVWAKDRQWWVQLKRRLNGMEHDSPNAFDCPRDKEGKPAPELRNGTPDEAGMKADATDAIDTVCRAWAEESREPLAVCLARHGVVFFHKAYGTRYGEPMTADTKSWMASISKLLSGALMMTLVDRGLVNLDEPLDQYLPALRGIAVKHRLTVRDLYTHTSGLALGFQAPRAAPLPDHWGDERNDYEEIVAEYYPHLEVGSSFSYGGTAYALGGKVMESLTGEALPQLFQRQLWGPLGCERTDSIDGSAWTTSVPLDIAKVGQMMLNKGAYGNKRFFSEETFEKMLPVKLAPYVFLKTDVEWGIGVAWTPEPGLGKGTFGHGAASGAILRIDPENGLVIVMTRNTGGPQYGKYHPRFIRAIVEGLAK